MSLHIRCWTLLSRGLEDNITDMVGTSTDIHLCPKHTLYLLTYKTLCGLDTHTHTHTHTRLRAPQWVCVCVCIRGWSGSISISGRGRGERSEIANPNTH